MKRFINDVIKWVGLLVIMLGLELTVYVYVDDFYFQVGGYVGVALFGVLLMYLVTSYEKGLEKELDNIHYAFCEQVKATDIAEAKYTRIKEEYSELEKKKEYLEKEGCQIAEVLMRVTNILSEEHGLLIDEIDDWEDLEKSVKVIKLPFTSDNDTTEQGYVCPECGVEMTRQTERTVFCDNIECSRKQWRKEKLEG